MSAPLALATIVAALMLVSLTAYALSGGADFGGGVWDFLASGPRRAQQRALISHAIGPIWEANHVWLIIVVVLLFTCFPPAFALLAITLHIPLALMLIGIVLRGSAFAFRTYDSHQDGAQRRWGRTFAIASTATPVLLGICIGAITEGRLVIVPGEPFLSGFVMPWLTPFTIGVGVFALALFAFLAAVYLTMDAPDEPLREDFRVRALIAAAAVFVAAFGVLLLAQRAAPRMHAWLTTSIWALPLQVATALAALTAIWALWARRYPLARFAAVAQVTLILWGWALALYPYIVPPTLTLEQAAAPAITLRLVLWALAIGAVVLFPSLYYLFRVFKRGEEAFDPLDREE
ncbi:MAG TPA: cytochrome d ubiquinol oxidase subunit II [Gemmatimonadaceae bacterium]